MTDEFFLNHILPLIFLISGLGLLTAAVRFVTHTRSFLAKALRTTGTVAALDPQPVDEPGDARTYRPAVTFKTASGQTIRFESLAHSAPAQYAIGASVPVLYDPAQPTGARIEAFTSLWLPALILGGLGAIFTALGAGFLTFGVPA